ncbi:MAG: hypothetical protein FWD56_06190 [Bacteroidales bacterium]|nr:hypothetical protein [Bacteroidales bacterium]
MIYSKEKMLEKASNALKSENFYKGKFLNYRGKAQNGERYSEILSEFLIKNRSILDEGIPSITRKKSYKVKEHNWESTTGRKRVDSKEKEQHIAFGMGNKTFNYIGKVIDYQIPLKDNNSIKGVGKIDLLSCDNNNLYILELKGPESKETLLRSILEIYTYWQIVDRKKLANNFDCENFPVCKGILIEKNCQAYKDFKLPKTKELTRLLEIDVYVYVYENEEITQIIDKLQ